MGAVPERTRGGRGGKLIDVLDHQLRIGDQDAADAIIAAYRERGLTPPDHVVAPPAIDPKYLAYWEAWRDLISERVQPRGPIPVTAIVQYALLYGLDPDELKRIVWKVDRVLLDHWKQQDDVDKNKTVTVDAKPALPGGKQ